MNSNNQLTNAQLNNITTEFNITNNNPVLDRRFEKGSSTQRRTQTTSHWNWIEEKKEYLKLLNTNEQNLASEQLNDLNELCKHIKNSYNAGKIDPFGLQDFLSKENLLLLYLVINTHKDKCKNETIVMEFLKRVRSKIHSYANNWGNNNYSYEIKKDKFIIYFTKTDSIKLDPSLPGSHAWLCSLFKHFIESESFIANLDKNLNDIQILISYAKENPEVQDLQDKINEKLSLENLEQHLFIAYENLTTFEYVSTKIQSLNIITQILQYLSNYKTEEKLILEISEATIDCIRSEKSQLNVSLSAASINFLSFLAQFQLLPETLLKSIIPITCDILNVLKKELDEKEKDKEVEFAELEDKQESLTTDKLHLKERCINFKDKYQKWHTECILWQIEYNNFTDVAKSVVNFFIQLFQGKYLHNIDINLPNIFSKLINPTLLLLKTSIPLADIFKFYSLLAQNNSFLVQKDILDQILNKIYEIINGVLSAPFSLSKKNSLSEGLKSRDATIENALIFIKAFVGSNVMDHKNETFGSQVNFINQIALKATQLAGQKILPHVLDLLLSLYKVGYLNHGTQDYNKQILKQIEFKLSEDYSHDIQLRTLEILECIIIKKILKDHFLGSSILKNQLISIVQKEDVPIKIFNKAWSLLNLIDEQKNLNDSQLNNVVTYLKKVFEAYADETIRKDILDILCKQWVLKSLATNVATSLLQIMASFAEKPELSVDLKNKTVTIIKILCKKKKLQQNISQSVMEILMGFYSKDKNEFPTQPIIDYTLKLLAPGSTEILEESLKTKVFAILEKILDKGKPPQIIEVLSVTLSPKVSDAIQLKSLNKLEELLRDTQIQKIQNFSAILEYVISIGKVRILNEPSDKAIELMHTLYETKIIDDSTYNSFKSDMILQLIHVAIPCKNLNFYKDINSSILTFLNSSNQIFNPTQVDIIVEYFNNVFALSDDSAIRSEILGTLTKLITKSQFLPKSITPLFETLATTIKTPNIPEELKNNIISFIEFCFSIEIHESTAEILLDHYLGLDDSHIMIINFNDDIVINTFKILKKELFKTKAYAILEKLLNKGKWDLIMSLLPTTLSTKATTDLRFKSLNLLEEFINTQILLDESKLKLVNNNLISNEVMVMANQKRPDEIQCKAIDLLISMDKKEIISLGPDRINSLLNLYINNQEKNKTLSDSINKLLLYFLEKLEWIEDNKKKLNLTTNQALIPQLTKPEIVTIATYITQAYNNSENNNYGIKIKYQIFDILNKLSIMLHSLPVDKLISLFQALASNSDDLKNKNIKSKLKTLFNKLFKLGIKPGPDFSKSPILDTLDYKLKNNIPDPIVNIFLEDFGRWDDMNVEERENALSSIHFLICYTSEKITTSKSFILFINQLNTIYNKMVIPTQNDIFNNMMNNSILNIIKSLTIAYPQTQTTFSNLTIFKSACKYLNLLEEFKTSINKINQNQDYTKLISIVKDFAQEVDSKKSNPIPPKEITTFVTNAAILLRQKALPFELKQSIFQFFLSLIPKKNKGIITVIKSAVLYAIASETPKEFAPIVLDVYTLLVADNPLEQNQKEHAEKLINTCISVFSDTQNNSISSQEINNFVKNVTMFLLELSFDSKQSIFQFFLSLVPKKDRSTINLIKDAVFHLLSKNLKEEIPLLLELSSQLLADNNFINHQNVSMLINGWIHVLEKQNDDRMVDNHCLILSFLIESIQENSTEEQQSLFAYDKLYPILKKHILEYNLNKPVNPLIHALKLLSIVNITMPQNIDIIEYNKLVEMKKAMNATDEEFEIRAPSQGKETRNLLSEKMNELLDSSNSEIVIHTLITLKNMISKNLDLNSMSPNLPKALLEKVLKLLDSEDILIQANALNLGVLIKDKNKDPQQKFNKKLTEKALSFLSPEKCVQGNRPEGCLQMVYILALEKNLEDRYIDEIVSLYFKVILDKDLESFHKLFIIMQESKSSKKISKELLLEIWTKSFSMMHLFELSNFQKYAKFFHDLLDEKYLDISEIGQLIENAFEIIMNFNTGSYSIMKFITSLVEYESQKQSAISIKNKIGGSVKNKISKMVSSMMLKYDKIKFSVTNMSLTLFANLIEQKILSTDDMIEVISTAIDLLHIDNAEIKIHVFRFLNKLLPLNCVGHKTVQKLAQFCNAVIIDNDNEDLKLMGSSLLTILIEKDLLDTMDGSFDKAINTIYSWLISDVFKDKFEFQDCSVNLLKVILSKKNNRSPKVGKKLFKINISEKLPQIMDTLQSLLKMEEYSLNASLLLKDLISYNMLTKKQTSELFNIICSLLASSSLPDFQKSISIILEKLLVCKKLNQSEIGSIKKILDRNSKTNSQPAQKLSVLYIYNLLMESNHLKEISNSIVQFLIDMSSNNTSYQNFDSSHNMISGFTPSSELSALSKELLEELSQKKILTNEQIQMVKKMRGAKFQTQKQLYGRTKKTQHSWK